MAPISRHKLNKVISGLEPGVPVTVRDLAESHISADLAGHYQQAGWLDRLGRGVYAKPGTALDLDASLVTLQQLIPALHVAGRSALERHGLQQYIAPSRPLTLLGSASARLPAWFTTHFPANYHQKRLFDELPDALLYVHPLGTSSRRPMVSAFPNAHCSSSSATWGIGNHYKRRVSFSKAPTPSASRYFRRSSNIALASRPSDSADPSATSWTFLRLATWMLARCQWVAASDGFNVRRTGS